MPFLIVCTNKGCGKTQSAYIDLNDNQVYCSECEGVIQNVSSFAKNQMKSLKQIKKDNKKSFCFKCPSCKKESRPKEINGDYICGLCNKSLNLSPIYKNMLKENLIKADDDV